MFTGLSAFPITPFKQEVIDYKAFKGLVENLASANVDSICAIGSTGLYPYLTRGEKYDVAKLAVDHANGIPVMAGVGALRTYDVRIPQTGSWTRMTSPCESSHQFLAFS